MTDDVADSGLAVRSTAAAAPCSPERTIIVVAASVTRSALVARALEDSLDDLAEIVQIPLGTKVARLEKHPGCRPVLYINTNASPHNLWRVLTEVKEVLREGSGVAATARWVRQLHAVS